MNNHIYNVSRYLIGIFGIIMSACFIARFVVLLMSSIRQRDYFSCFFEALFTIIFLLLFVGIVLTWAPTKWSVVIQSRHTIISYRLKQKCIIDMTKPVYYATMWHQWGRYLPDKVIVISNEPFPVHIPKKTSKAYYHDKDDYNFRSDYDERKQIMIYLTSYSKKHLPLSQWIGLNEDKDLSLWW